MNALYLLAAKIPRGEVGVPRVGANEVVQGVLNTVYIAAGMAAVIVIIVAGILYTISDGDSNRTKRAREAIMYAIIGLVIVMMAFVITNFIIGRF